MRRRRKRGLAALSPRRLSDGPPHRLQGIGRVRAVGAGPDAARQPDYLDRVAHDLGSGRRSRRTSRHGRHSLRKGGGMVDAKGEYPLCAPYLPPGSAPRQGARVKHRRPGRPQRVQGDAPRRGARGLSHTGPWAALRSSLRDTDQPTFVHGRGARAHPRVVLERAPPAPRLRLLPILDGHATLRGNWPALVRHRLEEPPGQDPTKPRAGEGWRTQDRPQQAQQA